MPDNRKPLIYGSFPVCRNYTVRAHIRDLGTQKWCGRADTLRNARTLQRGVHAQHLRPLHAQHARAGCGHHRSNDRPGSGVTQGIAGALSKRQRAPFLVKNTDFMYVLCAAEWSFRAISYCFVHRRTSRFGSRFGSKRDFKNMVELFDCKIQEKAPKSSDFGAFYGKLHPLRYQ